MTAAGMGFDQRESSGITAKEFGDDAPGGDFDQLTIHTIASFKARELSSFHIHSLYFSPCEYSRSGYPCEVRRPDLLVSFCSVLHQLPDNLFLSLFLGIGKSCLLVFINGIHLGAFCKQQFYEFDVALLCGN